MPQTPHIEHHFTAGETVRDIVIGMSDGLTVPFALAAGLSGAVSSTTIIITAGLAEIAAGSIAMGLGGYLAARSDAEHYASERLREQQEIKEKTEAEKAEVIGVFTSYGLTEAESAPIVEALSKRPRGCPVPPNTRAKMPCRLWSTSLRRTLRPVIASSSREWTAPSR